MPRPISWLYRLLEIRRTVCNSVRSHYERKDLERLFELQPRAAQKLLELLPTVPIGTSRLVERQALNAFLDGVHEAEDATAFLERVRQEKATVSQKKLRSLVPRDVEPIEIGSLPESIGLSRGRLEISFASIEQLAQAMYAIARVLEADGDAFIKTYEPEAPPPDQSEADEVRAMFAELEAMQAQKTLQGTNAG